MNKIPIVFCYDDNLEMPACVCIWSLLKHANPGTFYDIFILHEDEAQFVKGRVNELPQLFPNCSITYRAVGEAFKGAFEIRGITIAAYYRLLIPEIVPEYPKIFYFDVDVIFRNDLAKLFLETDLEGMYVAGVSTPYSDIKDYVTNIVKMKIDQYICSGTLIINSQKIIEDNLIPQFKQIANQNWKYQDQDTLNIVCRDKIMLMPPSFGVVGTVAEILSDPEQVYYDEDERQYALKYGIIHYNGAKPWKSWCYNFDIWWEYYRKSIFFDPKFYFEFYHAKLNEYDSLSLWKRLKILFRYFKIHA